MIGDDDLSVKIFQIMEKNKDAFFTVLLHPSSPFSSPLPMTTDPDNLIECDLMDGRDAFLTMARAKSTPSAWAPPGFCKRISSSVVATRSTMSTRARTRSIVTRRVWRESDGAAHVGRPRSGDDFPDALHPVRRCRHR